LGTHFQGHFSRAWPWQMENVKGIFEGTRPISECTEANLALLYFNQIQANNAILHHFMDGQIKAF
jgi:hypothetical protein